MREAYIRCPFWRKTHNSRTIGCEGLTDDSTIVQLFPDSAACERSLEIFCAGRYENCELYGAIMLAKYQED